MKNKYLNLGKKSGDGERTIWPLLFKEEENLKFFCLYDFQAELKFFSLSSGHIGKVRKTQNFLNCFNTLNFET